MADKDQIDQDALAAEWGVALEAELLEVDPDRPHLGQQPGELARPVGAQHRHDVVVTPGPAVLAGNPGDAGVARRDGGREGAQGAVGPGV